MAPQPSCTQLGVAQPNFNSARAGTHPVRMLENVRRTFERVVRVHEHDYALASGGRSLMHPGRVAFLLPVEAFVFKEKVGWRSILGTVVALLGVGVLFLF